MRSDLEISSVDKADEQSLHDVWSVAHAADAHDRPFDLRAPWSTALRTWQLPPADYDSAFWTARLGGADGQVAGAAQVGLPMLDNTSTAYVDGAVLPEHRRPGSGSALLDVVVGPLGAIGRTVLQATPHSPVDREGPGEAMLLQRGFEVAISAMTKAADLVATEATWDALEAQIAPYHAAYQLVPWRERVPDDLVSGYCALNAAFLDEAPMGDLDYEPEVWDADRVRARDDRFVATGRHQFGVLAYAADGTCVATTELFVNEVASWRAFQGGTLVLPAHRGHRLGLAVKLANQRAVRAAYPDCTDVFTDNAGVNAPMNAVNETLGFRDVERSLEMQRRL
jgi:GNAT superfamily N-acetyltransferase